MTVRAATFFMQTLYQHLFGEGEWHNQSNPDIAAAIRYARKTLYNHKERRSTYNEPIELEEWIIPVVYQNTATDLPWRDFRQDEQAQRDAYDARTFHQNPAPPDQFIGRDLDILEIENKIAQRNILLIRGGTGIGKTTLLHHLAWWWQNTYAVDKVFYFGYDEKPWTHQQVLQTIAQPLFGAETPQGTVVNRLIKERHLLIFDALECVNQSEKTALHEFLMRLDDGKSLILLGSQQNMTWLAKGTFRDNIHELSGIDNTSANIFMKTTLKRHNISYNDKDIRDFYLQVEKNPLLLEIGTRAMLEKKTALLSALQAKMTRMDIQGEAKQQSILHAAIEHIYNTLTPDEQGLLLCLAPLKFAIKTNTLSEYSQRLQQHAVLADIPFEHWENVLKKVADWGLLRLYPEVLLHSAFADFIRNRLIEKAEGQDAIKMASFEQYCETTLKNDGDKSTQIGKMHDGNIFSGTENVYYNVTTSSPVVQEERRNLLILLNKVKQFWVEGILEKSVHHAILIELGKTLQPEKVEHPWEKILEIPEQNNQILSPDKAIRDVFKEVGDLLLILGEPGSGKTITLLELARTLINDAKNNSNQPIPVVFNLSSWVGEPIFDWLVSELSNKYFIPKKFSRTWLENQYILSLLDGLDEIKTENRAVCVDAINLFVQETGVSGLVVCSRLQEYTTLPTRLKLNGAICIQPLTSKQVNDYLARVGSQLDALHHLLQTDQNLQTLAKSPLMLNVMSLTYHGLPVETVNHEECDTLEERRKNLFDAYIECIFKRKGKAKQPYEKKQVIDGLSWLARKMKKHGKTVFLIEELQPSWLENRWNYKLILGLVLELISIPLGVLFGLLINQFSSGLIVGLFLGLIGGLIGGLDNQIEPKENLSFSRSKWDKTDMMSMIGMMMSSVASIGVGAISVFGINGLIIAVIFGLIFLLIEARMENNVVETKTLINEGIQLSLKNSIYGGIIFGVIVGMSFLLIRGFIDELGKVLIGGVIGGLISGFWYFGGKEVIQHYSLRLTLYFKNYTPLNYGNFLEYAVKLIFLQKVGGGYIFIHRLLLEHFVTVRQKKK